MFQRIPIRDGLYEALLGNCILPEMRQNALTWPSRPGRATPGCIASSKAVDKGNP